MIRGKRKLLLDPNILQKIVDQHEIEKDLLYHNKTTCGKISSSKVKKTVGIKDPKKLLAYSQVHVYKPEPNLYE